MKITPIFNPQIVSGGVLRTILSDFAAMVLKASQYSPVGSQSQWKRMSRGFWYLKAPISLKIKNVRFNMFRY